jgi:uncharacterized protein
MPSVAPEPPPVAARAPSWGLGDVVVGLFTAVAGSNVVSAIVLAATGRSFEDFDDLPLSLLAITQLGLWVGLLGVPVMAARFKGNGAVRDFAIRWTGRDVWVGGLAGALLQIPLLPLLYWPLLELLDKTTEELEGPARELTERASDPFGVVLLVLIVGIGAPIVEEVFYRGLFQRSLLKRGLAPWLAIGVSSVVFGAMHLQVLQFPALTLFGVLAGYLAYRYDRLGPAITAHIAFNMVTVVALLSSS